MCDVLTPVCVCAAKTIKLYQNGDKSHAGASLTLLKGITTMDKLLQEMTKKVKLTTGAAKRAYLIGGRESKSAAGLTFTQLTGLDSIEDGGSYLICGPEKLDKVKLPQILYQ